MNISYYTDLFVCYDLLPEIFGLSCLLINSNHASDAIFVQIHSEFKPFTLGSIAYIAFIVNHMSE